MLPALERGMRKAHKLKLSRLNEKIWFNSTQLLVKSRQKIPYVFRTVSSECDSCDGFALHAIENEFVLKKRLSVFVCKPPAEIFKAVCLWAVFEKSMEEERGDNGDTGNDYHRSKLGNFLVVPK